MRKILPNLSVTLDGFIEGALGEYDCCFTNQDYGIMSFLERSEGYDSGLVQVIC